jgi:hypothetical protein
LKPEKISMPTKLVCILFKTYIFLRNLNGLLIVAKRRAFLVMTIELLSGRDCNL